MLKTVSKFIGSFALMVLIFHVIFHLGNIVDCLKNPNSTDCLIKNSFGKLLYFPECRDEYLKAAEQHEKMSRGGSVGPGISPIITLKCALHDNFYSNTEKIEVGDVRQFGASFLDKKIEFEGVIASAYPCRHPENRGNQCLIIHKDKNKSSLAETVQIKVGVYSPEQYKDWINNQTVVMIRGKVALKPTTANTQVPTVIGTEIKVIQ